MSRLGVLLGLCVLVLSVPASASAHASLVATDPPAGARVASRPDAVTLRFSEAVDPPVDVVVTGPTGQRVSAGRTAVFGERVTQRLLPTATGSGDYTVSYQVLSSDGHVVNGTTHFTVSGGGTGSPTGASGGARPSVVVVGLAFMLLLVLGLTGVARVAEAVDD